MENSENPRVFFDISIGSEDGNSLSIYSDFSTCEIVVVALKN